MSFYRAAYLLASSLRDRDKISQLQHTFSREIPTADAELATLLLTAVYHWPRDWTDLDLRRVETCFESRALTSEVLYVYFITQTQGFQSPISLAQPCLFP